MVRPFKLAVTLAALAIGVSSARADYVVYDNTVAAGNQAYAGSLGIEFTPSANMQVTSLGVFSPGVIAAGTTLTVRIFDAANPALSIATAFFTSSGVYTRTNSDLFQTVAGPVLLSGHTYMVEADGFNANNLNYNSGGGAPPGTINGPITTIGGFYSNAPGVFPGTGPNTPPPNYFGAGTFTAVTIPEPSSVALLGFGVVGLVVAARRRRAQV